MALPLTRLAMRASTAPLARLATQHAGIRMLPGVISSSMQRLTTSAVLSAPQKDSLKATNQGLSRQADSGIGSEAFVEKPSVPEGTIEVTIGGESSPAASHDSVGTLSIARKDGDWTLSHPLWNGEFVGRVHYTHLPPTELRDKLALYTIKTIRFNFDWMSGYSFGPLTEKKALTRIVFLETVAGVPGSVAALIRHLASLRRMKRDGGWIATLMSEAENERMHLLTSLELRKPGPFMRSMVFLCQGVFFNFFFTAYLLSPRFCHRLVGYLEEEAVVTYTKMLQNIDAGGELKAWATMPAPPIAKKYWALSETSTMRDVIAHIRADEAHHRDVNHTLGSIDQEALNPFRNKI